MGKIRGVLLNILLLNSINAYAVTPEMLKKGYEQAQKNQPNNLFNQFKFQKLKEPLKNIKFKNKKVTPKKGSTRLKDDEYLRNIIKELRKSRL